MFEKFKNWVRKLTAHEDGSNASPRPKPTGERRRAGGDRRKRPEAPENVLIRNKYQREDTGTHETLKIVDDSLVDTGEETGIDPYNTGNFDRSRNWDKRFRN